MKDKFFQKCEKITGSESMDLTTDPPSFYPSSENAFCEIVRSVHSEKYKIRIKGNGTYPVPDSDNNVIPLSTRALSVIKEVNIDDFLIVVQAGAIVDDITNLAENSGLYMPLDITSADISTIGGAFMTGAIGPSTTGYGAFGKSVTGIRCITAQGDVVTFGGRTAKNVTGYDVAHFLTGTMGLYALAVELIIKVNPLPESRLMTVARFLPESKPFYTVDSIISSLRDIKIFELIANEGLGGEISIGVGFEGIKSLAKRNINFAQDIMNHAGAETVRMKDYKNFMAKRRIVAKTLIGSGFYTISVPPASSGVFMKKIKAVSPEIPVIAHPKIGRFHLVCRDADQIDKLRKATLAIGGKQPVEWELIKRKGIAGLFTKPELGIARSLKREIDPLGKFNPHLRLI